MGLCLARGAGRQARGVRRRARGESRGFLDGFKCLRSRDLGREYGFTLVFGIQNHIRKSLMLSAVSGAIWFYGYFL